jgi:hypothetical protein
MFFFFFFFFFFFSNLKFHSKGTRKRLTASPFTETKPPKKENNTLIPVWEFYLSVEIGVVHFSLRVEPKSSFKFRLRVFSGCWMMMMTVGSGRRKVLSQVAMRMKKKMLSTLGLSLGGIWRHHTKTIAQVKPKIKPKTLGWMAKSPGVGRR